MKVESPTREADVEAGVCGAPPPTVPTGAAGEGEQGPAGRVVAGPVVGFRDDGPVGQAVAELAAVDRAMARLLRAIADAGPVDGLPAGRLIGLAARATGWDISYLRRMTETLSAMTGVWQAFDDGLMSWSQLRGICAAAKCLSVADRHELDRQLSGAVAQNGTAEPDRLVEVAGDLADRLDDAAADRRDQQADRANGLRFTPDLFGGANLYGHLDAQLAAWVTDAVYAAADSPVAEGDRPVDGDGKPIPRSWMAPTHRAGQLAEGLGRVAADWLAGHLGVGPTGGDGDNGDETVDSTGHGNGHHGAAHADGQAATDSRRGTNDAGITQKRDNCDDQNTDDGNDAGENSDGAPSGNADAGDPDHGDGDGGAVSVSKFGRAGRRGRPTAMVVVDINDLLPAGQRGTDGVPAATARLLWRLAGGRSRQSKARVQALSCDAVHVPLLTDGDIPIAIGDAHDPIPVAVRRAAAARDQGCRFPGCNQPVQHTDLHHVRWREHGGPTELANLVSLCRGCHNLVHRHGWQMILCDDGRLTVRRGRYRFSSRPRLRPPVSTAQAHPTRSPPPTDSDPPGDGVNLAPASTAPANPNGHGWDPPGLTMPF